MFKTKYAKGEAIGCAEIQKTNLEEFSEPVSLRLAGPWAPLADRRRRKVRW